MKNEDVPGVAVFAPWHVRLRISSPTYGEEKPAWRKTECAGAVRNASFVVSAAHCFVDLSTRRPFDRLSVTISVPSYDAYTSGNYEEIYVCHSFIFPEYRFQLL